MKKLVFIALTCLLPFCSHCQDIIINKKGDEIKSKVTEISNSEIRYKKFDNLDGPVIVISKKEVVTILYQNGSRETFTESNNATNNTTIQPIVSNYDISKDYLLGMKDAEKNYKPKGVKVVTAVYTFCTGPLLGLIPALLYSSRPIKISKTGITDSINLSNKEYMSGYMKGATIKRRKKAWGGYVAGLIPCVIVGIAAAATAEPAY
jgi:hypothetical protein